MIDVVNRPSCSQSTVTVDSCFEFSATQTKIPMMGWPSASQRRP